MIKRFAIFTLSAVFLASCGGEEATTDETTVTEEPVVENCTYTYNPDETVLTWTAFKLTEKVAVSGTFDQINVTANDGASDMFATLTGATFSIPVSSLNSQDEVRDPKIKNSFFGIMSETDMLSGSIIALAEKEGTVSITMNSISKEYTGEVKVDGEQITFLTTINLMDFDGQEAMDSLGVVCEAKHTGPDGVNKLWTDVEIAVKTILTKTCQ